MVVRARLLSLLVLAGVGCGTDGDPTSPGVNAIGFRFEYTDSLGRQAVLAADSGTWQIQPTDSTIYTDQWTTAPDFFGPPIQLFLANTIHTPGTVYITRGTYPVEDALAYRFQYLTLAQFVAGRSLTGTVTITQHDATILAGSIDIAFRNWRGSDLFPFSLRGPFRLTYKPS